MAHNRSRIVDSCVFFIYSPFVHISLVLNNIVAARLLLYVHIHTRRVSLCQRCAVIAVYRLNKTFLRYALTYYYYRYHYRKNKSLNNHIRVVREPFVRGRGIKERGKGKDKGPWDT